MHLNTLKPGVGSRRPYKRVGRGIGCGSGKTCGRGHKGQRARAGGFHKIGFEGGQMPLQRRLPKFGFITLRSLDSAKISLADLNKVDADVINLDTLKSANVITKNIKAVKIFASGQLNKPLTIQGILVTKGAKTAIEAAGGKIEA